MSVKASVADNRTIRYHVSYEVYFVAYKTTQNRWTLYDGGFNTLPEALRVVPSKPSSYIILLTDKQSDAIALFAWKNNQWLKLKVKK